MLVAPKNRNNIVLTGLGRSGTTLCCNLLNKLPDALALAEPIAPRKFEEFAHEHDQVALGVERFFRRMRRMAREERQVVSKHVGGVVPENSFSSSSGAMGREKVVGKGKIAVTKELSPDFTLIIKDPPMFISILQALSRRFPCYATVRNPLAVIASRASTGLKRAGDPTSTPMRYDLELPSKLEGVRDELDREIVFINHFFERIAAFIPRENVIRYEDLVSSGGKALSVICPAAERLSEPLSSRNLNELYDREEMLQLGERLLASEGAYWDFYSKADIENLLESIERMAYANGYVDAAMGLPVRLPGPSGYSAASVRDDLEYLRGYGNGEDTLREGHHDPISTAAQMGWISLADVEIEPFSSRRARALHERKARRPSSSSERL